jgi:hypothetical protein
MDALTTELIERWSRMFAALAGGGDAPPALRLRAEGMMEALVLLNMATASELTATMDKHYQCAFGQSIAEDFGEDWQEFYPFPQIPAMGSRAPVYPSTHD